MLTRLLCIALAVTMMTAVLPPPAEAQFRTFRKVLKAPVRALPRAGRVLPGAVGRGFRRTFGVVAAVAVGAVILDTLPRGERREVARRANAVVAKDPESEVSDSFSSKDGRRQVTIIAEPMQTAAAFKDDPAILMVADTVVAPGETDAGKADSGKTDPDGKPRGAGDTALAADGGPESAPAAGAVKAAAGPDAKPVVDEEVVRIGDIPPDTQCRKVTTALELRKKKGQKTPDQTDTNTAIFCQTAPGEWKPASA